MIWRCDLVPQYHRFQTEIDEAIKQVLQSGRYTLGTEVAAFEQEFADYNNVAHAIGVASGTDGLFLALKAFEIGKGDQVITTPFTAIPTVSVILAVGATPVFVDVCEDSFLIDIQKIPEAITPRTRAILPVHLFGNMVDIPKLQELVGEDFPIIEDACQAHGSTLGSLKAGSLGHIGVFSFYPTKNLGGYGDGGAVITNNSELAEKIRILRMYGMTDKDHTIMPGFNSRLDEIQAAILRLKLRYLDEMNEKRNRLARHYIINLKTSFIHQKLEDGVFSNYHVFASRFTGDREKLIVYLNEHDIQTNIYYPIPLHLQEAFTFLHVTRGSLPVAEKLCEDILALPMYAELSEDVVHLIARRINDFICTEG